MQKRQSEIFQTASFKYRIDRQPRINGVLIKYPDRPSIQAAIQVCDGVLCFPVTLGIVTDRFGIRMIILVQRRQGIGVDEDDRFFPGFFIQAVGPFAGIKERPVIFYFGKRRAGYKEQDPGHQDNTNIDKTKFFEQADIFIRTIMQQVQEQYEERDAAGQRRVRFHRIFNRRDKEHQQDTAESKKVSAGKLVADPYPV